MIAVPLLIFAIITFAWLYFTRFAQLRQRQFRCYIERPCTGFLWWRAFPSRTKEEFRVFLGVIASSFGLKLRNRCIFRPDDRLIDLFDIITPKTFWTLIEIEEDEILRSEFSRRYGILLEEVWTRETTLGDLFELCVVHK